jgi:hypothetical protein
MEMLPEKGEKKIPGDLEILWMGSRFALSPAPW